MLNLFLKYSANLGANGKVNIAIVGGGATGVELSAELHNAVKQLHSYGYKGLTNEALNVTLVEAGERILPALPPRISGAAHNELTKLGVRVLTQTMVTSADAGGLHTKDGEYIEADLMVWAAGIKAPDFMKEIGGLETNPYQSAGGRADAADYPRCGYFRHRRLRLLRPSGRRLCASAGPGGAPDGYLRAEQHPGADERQTAEGIHL